jgi:cytochrome c556
MLLIDLFGREVMRVFFVILSCMFFFSSVLAMDFNDWDNPQAVYDYRANLMQNNKSQMQAMNQALRTNDFATLALGAEDILTTYRLLQKLFENKESVQFPSSESRPEIWTQPARFAAMVAEAQRAAEDFSVAVARKDNRLIALHYRELGQSCRTCHSSFRK